MSELTKTTVYLSEPEYRALKALARKRGCPAAELVREAVCEYARRQQPPKRLPRSLGAGRSGRGDLSECAEELLEGMGRDRR
jgi:hypothetical protein